MKRTLVKASLFVLAVLTAAAFGPCDPVPLNRVPDGGVGDMAAPSDLPDLADMHGDAPVVGTGLE